MSLFLDCPENETNLSRTQIEDQGTENEDEDVIITKNDSNLK
jgi:hypothetical protein